MDTSHQTSRGMEAETSGSPSYVSDSQLQMWPPGGAVPQFSEGYSSHLMSYAFTLWHGNGLLSTFRSAGGRSSALRRQLFRLIPAIKRRSPALYHLIAQSLQKPNDPNPLSACHCFCDGVRLPPSLPPSLGSRPVQRELAQQLKGQKKKKGQREMLAQKNPISNKPRRKRNRRSPNCWKEPPNPNASGSFVLRR